MAKRGRHEIDDSAVLLKMAEGLAEGKFASAWEAAGAFSKSTEGSSSESTRRRLATKYLKAQDGLQEQVRKEKEDETAEPGVYGFDADLYRRFARYLSRLKTAEERAKVIAKFLIATRERYDLTEKVRRILSKAGHRFRIDDEIFLQSLTWEIEEIRMNWSEIWRKSEEIESEQKESESPKSQASTAKLGEPE